MKTVLLHGLGQNASTWESVIQEMGSNDTVVAPHLFPIEPCTFENLYTRFVQYCDNECLDRFNVCGLSLGGMLALKYAIDHPERVERLILIGVQAKIPARVLKFQNLIFRILPHHAFDSLKMSKKEVLELACSMLELDFTKDLASLTCPVLIVCGEKDTFNKKSSTLFK